MIEVLRSNSEFSNLFLDDQGPRGLERLSSRLHAIRRATALQEVKHAVFLEQARQTVTNQRNTELLARQAEFAARNSRAFANLLGMGDAWAVAQQELEEQEQQQKLPAMALHQIQTRKDGEHQEGKVDQQQQQVFLPETTNVFNPPAKHGRQKQDQSDEVLQERAGSAASTTKLEEG